MSSGFFEKFWDRISPEPNSGCWIWTGAKSRDYGSVSYAGKSHRAHRLSWEMTNGRKIPEGLFACHKCDVRLCVNPNHIFIGTPSDNTQDCVRKGRHPLKSATHCKRGHLLSGGNLYLKGNGERDCRICRRAARKRHTVKTQIKRGIEIVERTHCKRGHLLDEATVYVRSNGKTECRKCRCGWVKLHYSRREFVTQDGATL